MEERRLTNKEHIDLWDSEFEEWAQRQSRIKASVPIILISVIMSGLLMVCFGVGMSMGILR